MQLLKKVEEAFYGLIWNNLQNVLLIEQSKRQNSVLSMLYLYKSKEEG